MTHKRQYIVVFFLICLPVHITARDVSESPTRGYTSIGNISIDTLPADLQPLMESLPSATKPDISIPDSALSDSSFNDTASGVIITADSAKIISPPALDVLDSSETVYEISPICPLDSAILLVHYFPSRIETLAILENPPYRTHWNYKHIPDQDQTQLQFGYVLYHSRGKIIKSPPLPHRWVIDRDRSISTKTFICHELPVDDSIVVDGLFDDWPDRAAGLRIGSHAQLRTTWTSAYFYAAIMVSDTAVTTGDRVELMFDMLQQKGSFAGIEQRIFSVGPRQRRFTWAVRLQDSASVQVDSILVRTGNEMEWRARETENGYAIEVKIPFVILADIEFPPPEFGFDAAVVDVSGDSRDESSRTISTWTKTHPASRHNPSHWGTVKLRQTWLPLKAILAGLVIVIFSIIAGMLWLIFYKISKDREEIRQDQKEISPISKTVLSDIQNNLSDSDYTLQTALKNLSIDKPALIRSIREDFGCDFLALLNNQRIRHARILLRDSDDKLDSICHTCGFSSENEFSRVFKQYAGVTPEIYRENKLADKCEEEEEEADE
ncbi:MAG: helix-turn-helix domain-containing protein [Chitinivibrionales bacterium]